MSNNTVTVLGWAAILAFIALVMYSDYKTAELKALKNCPCLALESGK